jgi:hypothetical protein
METAMSELESEDILAEEEIVHWSPKHGPLIGDGPPTSLEPPRPATPYVALAVGAAAFGAVAIGALAIGALAIGRMAVGRARIKDLRVDRLEVGELVVMKPRQARR